MVPHEEIEREAAVMMQRVQRGRLDRMRMRRMRFTQEVKKLHTLISQIQVQLNLQRQLPIILLTYLYHQITQQKK